MKNFFVYLLVGMVLLLCVVLVEQYIVANQKLARSGQCKENLHLQYEAISLYAMDYDSNLPLPSSWMVNLEAYISKVLPSTQKNMNVFQCPESSNGHGYNMNPSAKWNAIKPEQIYLIVETANLSLNAHDKRPVLPKPPRHWVSWELYLDGHLKSIK